MEEIWKKYYLDNDYLVSNLGNVRSLKTNIVMKKNIDRYGYEYISLKGKVNKKKKVHRLVAECFIENDKKLSQVNHKNGIKTDNNVKNLEWCSQSENIKHMFRELESGKSLKQKISERSLGKKLSIESRRKMSEARTGIKNGRCQKIVCEQTGIIFDYIKQAENIMKIKGISSSIGKYKVKGYSFKRLED